MKLRRTAITDEVKEYLRYKWEFLRRNQEFLDDRSRIDRLISEKNNNQQDNYYEPKEEKDHFLKKWKIPYWFAADLSFEEIFKKQPLDLEIFYEYFYVGFESITKPIKALEGYEEGFINIEDGLTYTRVSEKFSKTGKLSIEIDLNYSKNRLQNEFSKILSYWKQKYAEALRKQILYESSSKRDSNLKAETNEEFEIIYKAELKKREKKYCKKYHFENFDIYLKVYDLREFEKSSWGKIKKELGLDSVQTARNYFNAAKELIKKGVDL